MTPVRLVVPWRALFAVLLMQAVPGTLLLPLEHVHRADDAHRSSIVHRHSATHQADHHDDRDEVSLTEVEGQVVWLSAPFAQPPTSPVSMCWRPGAGPTHASRSTANRYPVWPRTSPG